MLFLQVALVIVFLPIDTIVAKAKVKQMMAIMMGISKYKDQNVVRCMSCMCPKVGSRSMCRTELKQINKQATHMMWNAIG